MSAVSARLFSGDGEIKKIRISQFETSMFDIIDA